MDFRYLPRLVLRTEVVPERGVCKPQDCSGLAFPIRRLVSSSPIRFARTDDAPKGCSNNSMVLRGTDAVGHLRSVKSIDSVFSEYCFQILYYIPRNLSLILTSYFGNKIGCLIYFDVIRSTHNQSRTTAIERKVRFPTERRWSGDRKAANPG
jgi:hypothetical protein